MGSMLFFSDPDPQPSFLNLIEVTLVKLLVYYLCSAGFSNIGHYFLPGCSVPWTLGVYIQYVTVRTLLAQTQTNFLIYRVFGGSDSN